MVYSSVMLEVIPEPIAALSIAIALLSLLGSDISVTQPELMFGLMILFARALMSIHMMQGIYKSLAAGQAAFWFINSMITRLDNQREHSSGDVSHQLQKEINLNNISFSYGEKNVVNNASFTIPVGNIVTVTGSSGAGKTTLLDLIIGLMQPDNGLISIDEVNLKDIDKDIWREQIGYVPQDTFMFHDTVFSNITLGDNSIERSAVNEALVHAEASSFVEKLENGMETIVGEKGMMLSGGQRQRLAIARALARNPKLLILDEATSSLDPSSEKSVCETLIKLSNQRKDLTILAISHQPALVEIADIVFTIKNGKVLKI
jgi:ATP-binding cassette subfamily C protein